MISFYKFSLSDYQGINILLVHYFLYSNQGENKLSYYYNSESLVYVFNINYSSISIPWKSSKSKFSKIPYSSF